MKGKQLDLEHLGNAATPAAHELRRDEVLIDWIKATIFSEKDTCKQPQNRKVLLTNVLLLESAYLLVLVTNSTA